MKYFIAITLFAAVASAAVVRPLNSELAEIQEIIAAIQSPSTDPATAAALEQMVLDILGVKPEPVAVGPAIIDYEPIAVGPAIIESPLEGIAVGPAVVDFPLPDGGAVAEEPAIIPSPVSVVEAGTTEIASGTPLVQIIVNINQAAVESSPISVGPAVAPELVEIKPEPVHVVESAPEPVQVVEVAPVAPVQVVEAAPEPVQVVEVAPMPVQVVEVAPVPSPISPPIAVNPIGVVGPEVEPVQIGVPVIPEAAVVLPEELN